jgi:lysophospholipase L1-like esterase
VTILWTSVASLIAGFIVLEMCARWWIRFRRAYYVLPPGLRLRLHIDRETFPELEPVVRFEVNGDGERGPDVPRVTRGERLYRVLVAGGSQPEGYLLDQETSWPGAVHALLAQPRHLATLGASKVHVGSIARSGIGAEALDLLLARVLPRYPHLDAIVILVGASDVLHWLEEGAPSAKAASRVPISDVFRCHPEGRFSWAPKALALVELFARLRRRWLRPLQVHHHAGRWVGGARATIIRETMPEPMAMMEHFDRQFRSVVRRARAHADRVVVVRQSWFAKAEYTQEEAAHMWHGGVGRAWCEEVTTFYSLDVTSRLMALLDGCAARVVRDLNVEQIDLMSLLEPSLSTYYDFFHLTPAGARTVASAVASRLLGENVGTENVGTGAFERPTARCTGLRAS